MFRLEFVFCFDFWVLDVTVCTGPGFTEISPLRINSLEFTLCLKLQLNAVILNIVIQLNTEIANVSHCQIQKDENGSMRRSCLFTRTSESDADGLWQ